MKRRFAIFKLLFFIIFAIIVNQKVVAQNLVPNPSFEDTVVCPFGLAQLYSTHSWISFGYTPDYFNSCNNTGVSVPNSVFGYQYAHSGNGMAGVVVRRRPNAPTGPNTREYIGTELINNLTIGLKYYFSCFINFSYFPVDAIACNKFGMKLSTVPYDSSQSLLLVNNFAHLFSDSIISDTVQWFNLKGSFVADSNYHYIILGNFFDDQQTDTLSFSPLPDNSYYYIDDVCLSIDSTYCDNWTSTPSIASTQESKPKIISSFDQITISSELNIKACTVYNSLGQIVYDRKGIKEKNATFSTNGFSTGIYFVQVRLEDERVYNLKVFRE